MDTLELKVSMLSGVIGSRRDARRMVTKFPDMPVEELHQRWLADQAITTPNVANTKRDLAFVMRTMMFSSMPIDAPEGDEWVRRFNLYREGRIAEGSITYKSIEKGTGVVYGSMDRKVLTILSSLAVQRRSGKLIFPSTADFLEKTRANKGSAYQDLRMSLERWQSCSINLKIDTEEDRTLSKRGIISDLHVPKQYSQAKLMIELDPRFVSSVLEEPFPIPWEYLEPFSKKPLGWDLAMFLAARVAACRTPTRIPIFSKNQEDLTLMRQFSSQDSNPWRWVGTLRGYLAQIKNQWADLNADIEGRYLVVHPSKYMVEYTGLQSYLLPAFVMDGEEPVPPTLFDSNGKV